MTERRATVARVRFSGACYEGHGLDSAAMAELVRFQKLLTGVAKAIWRRAHPKNARLPNHFEKGTMFMVRGLEAGSTVVRLEIGGQSNHDRQSNGVVETAAAVDLIYEAVTAVNGAAPLPDRFPASAAPGLAALGKRLADGAEMQFAPAGQTLMPVTLAPWKKVAPRSESGELHIPDRGAVSIQDKILSIFGNVTEDEWDNVPTDLAHRHDFYLYGEENE